MSVFDLSFWRERLRLLGFVAIVIGAGAWVTEFIGAVYICPYCRVQRTVILLLGVIMVLPFAGHWIAKYVRVHGRSRGGQSEFHGMGEDIEGRVRV